MTALAALLLAPLASGDHSWSHQLVVEGRVVDAHGDPVPGAAVSLEVSGATLHGDCVLGRREPKTNETGDFRLCRHAHALGPGVEARVEALGVSASAGVDPALRRAYLLLRFPDETPVHSIQGERAFHRDVAVTGRAMDARPGGVEDEDGVRVTGEPRAGRLVVATLLSSDATVLARGETMTDGNGDFGVFLRHGPLPEGARAQVAVDGEVREAPAPADARRVDLAFVVPPPGPQAPLPGTDAPLPLWVVLTATAFAACARAARGPPRRR